MVDLVVIGGGLAGLTAATRAAELGVGVRLLEQGEMAQYPCNSRYAGGIMHLAYQDPELPADELVEVLRSRCPDDIDFGLVELVVRNMKRSLDWLRQNGQAKFIKGGTKAYERLVLAPPRPAQSRLVWPGRGPDVLLRKLTEKAESLGVTITLGTRVTGLERAGSGGFVVSAETNGTPVKMDAKTVIIADGGFQADAELMQRHVSPDPAQLLQRNAGTGMGSGLRIAAQIGARVTNLKPFYGHVQSRQALENEDLWPYPFVDPLAVAGIVVGPDGLRFVDEGKGGVVVANALARCDNPAANFAVFDADTWEKAGRSVKVPPNPNLQRYGGTLHSAATLGELAQAAGIDAGALQKTVAERNAAIANNATDGLSPPRTGSLPADPIVTAPFYAAPVVAGVTHTMGGLMVDTKTRLQSVDGGSIEGLFAAGSTVGGLEGGDAIYYLGGLCKAAALGLVSGESAAAAIQE